MKVYTIDEIKIHLFNKITDVEFKDEVEEKYYKERYDICFREFCDISKKQIAHLTDVETFVVRKSLGILDHGVFQTDVSIGKILNLSHSRIGQIRAKALRKLYFVVTSSYELSDEDKKIIKESDSIQKLGLRYEYFILFHRNGIETIGDLNKLKSDELGEIIKNSRRYGAASFVINRMNELGYYFNNGVKDNPLLSKTIEELDFSVRTYNCLKRGNINIIGQLVSKNVNELLEIRNMGMRNVEEIINKLHKYGLSLSGEESSKLLEEKQITTEIEGQNNSVKSELLSQSIDVLDLSVRAYNCLKRGNINTIGKLVSKSVDELFQIRNMGIRVIDEIRIALHKYGLSFLGEDSSKLLEEKQMTTEIDNFNHQMRK